MLNRIININRNSDYKQSSSSQVVNSEAHSALEGAYTPHDIIELSPALKFIKDLNWKIKRLKVINDKKFILDFVFSDLFFQTDTELPDPEKINYIISKSDHNDYFILIDSFLHKNENQTKPDYLKSINNFIESIDAFIDETGEININSVNETALNLPEFTSELNYVTEQLIHLIEKLTQKKRELIQSEEKRSFLIKSIIRSSHKF